MNIPVMDGFIIITEPPAEKALHQFVIVVVDGIVIIWQSYFFQHKKKPGPLRAPANADSFSLPLAVAIARNLHKKEEKRIIHVNSPQNYCAWARARAQVKN